MMDKEYYLSLNTYIKSEKNFEEIESKLDLLKNIEYSSLKFHSGSELSHGAYYKGDV